MLFRSGFLIARCLLGLILAPAGLAGLCIPKLNPALKLGVPGIDFALPIGGAVRAAECDCVLKCPLWKGLPVRGGKLSGWSEVSHGKTGSEGSVTRRMHGGFGGECEGLGIEKFGILGLCWRVAEGRRGFEVMGDWEVMGEDSWMRRVGMEIEAQWEVERGGDSATGFIVYTSD